jgi:hypothetical protein
MASWTAETMAASRELHGLLDYSSTLRGSAEDVCSRADELLTASVVLTGSATSRGEVDRRTRQSRGATGLRHRRPDSAGWAGFSSCRQGIRQSRDLVAGVPGAGIVSIMVREG